MLAIGYFSLDSDHLFIEDTEEECSISIASIYVVTYLYMQSTGLKPQVLVYVIIHWNMVSYRRYKCL